MAARRLLWQPNRPAGGDLNGDGDHSDAATLQACMTGPSATAAPDCIN